jgi:hypothetical protein
MSMMPNKEDRQSMTRDEKKLIREIYLLLQECADKAGPSYLHERISRSKARCVSLLAPEMLNHGYSKIPEHINNMNF